TERFFAKKMGGNLTGTRFKRQAIRGGIKELGGSTAELGYKRNAKIDTHYIKRSIELEAIRKSERNKRLLNIRTQRTLDSDLSSLPEHPLKVEYKNTETPIIQRGRILQGMALKHGLMQLQLIEAYIEDTMSNTPAQI